LSETGAPATDKIFLGRIVGVHGLKGEVKATVGLDDVDTLEAVGQVELDGVPYRLLTARLHKNCLFLRLMGVQDRGQAEKLVGQAIWLDRHRLPLLPAGEFYWCEILGLPVFQADTGAYLGKVAAIIPTPAHDVYVVRDKEEEYLIPAVAEAIVAIDPDAGRLVVAPEYVAAQSGVY